MSTQVVYAPISNQFTAESTQDSNNRVDKLNIALKCRFDCSLGKGLHITVKYDVGARIT